MRNKILLVLCLLSCSASIFRIQAANDSFRSVFQLIDRRIPWLSGRVIIESSKTSDPDIFTLQTRRNKLHITAGSVSAASTALNWYLKYYCHRQMSHVGDNLAPVSQLPTIETPITHRSTAPIRYALNYCTYNYSFSFYTWTDWERELDWMALHGVNQMLVACGEEAVWQNVMQRMGFSDSDIRRFIPGPSYTAWWLMGNLEGQGGPMPQSQIDSRKVLTQKILQRMHELGIEPVMPGFFGMVPSTLKALSQASIAEQGKWISFTRPDIINPADPEFAHIADLFYEETKKLYGKDILFFSGDPFHEGGNTNGIEVEAIGKAIQDAMKRHFPNATWVLQGWQNNPRKEILAKMDKKSVLVQELFGENTANWQARNAYEGTPFIWCSVNNFGERPGLYGKLERMANEWHRVSHSSLNAWLRGIGIMPEGILNNPVIYELILELPWHSEKIDISQWIEQYALARYGTADSDISAAWQKLLASCYSSPDSYMEGPPENVLCARPSTSIHHTSSWGTTNKFYDKQLVEQAMNDFLKAGNRFARSETYQADAIELIAQNAMDNADSAYSQLIHAYKQKDAANFSAARTSILASLQGLDKLFSLYPARTLDYQVQQAIKAGNNEEEKRNNARNLLMHITYWGGEDLNNHDLDEYSYRHFGGMLNSFYAERWKLFLDALEKKMYDPSAPLPDFGEWNRTWVEQQMKRYFP